LRELVPITAGEAREVLQSLVRDGLLASRGVRRGTYYILSESAGPVDRAWPTPSAPLGGRTVAEEREVAK